MIQGVGQGGLAKAAFDAAMQTLQQRPGGSAQVGDLASSLGGVAGAFDKALAGVGNPEFASELGRTSGPRGVGGSFPIEDALSSGVRETDQVVKSADSLPFELLTGKVGDFHEVAGRLKQAELAFKFSMEVRNKLIDAYRETMRLSV
ncbi:MAG: flagellar hook-basal body complex protein FliE [Planctomycetaceae bacterium]|jgi:flagellar hook-basal body complex protein FliE|nr:flagellar hook-basal body complex protein FliE [Planctomycetaceae bacterium]